MHPDLYEDIIRTIEGINKELDKIPMDTDEEIHAYSLGLHAMMYLGWFLDAMTDPNGYESEGDD